MSAWHSSTFVKPASSTRRRAAATDSPEMSTDVIRASGLRVGQRDGLGADAAAGLQHGAARRIRRVGVQQLHECVRLVGQPVALALVVAVT